MYLITLQTLCHVNALKSYLHFGHLADAILCSNFFLFFFFVSRGLCLFHKNRITSTSDLTKP